MIGLRLRPEREEEKLGGGGLKEEKTDASISFLTNVRIREKEIFFSLPPVTDFFGAYS